MSSDLRAYLESDLRFHPRVAYQGMPAQQGFVTTVLEGVPLITPFRNEYCGAVAVVDWDHRLPSKTFTLRLYAYYSESSLAAGEEAYDDRLEDIGRRDMYPEFDVPDFDNLIADEAYDIELDEVGTVGRCRLTSAWRRNIAPNIGARAVAIASRSTEYSNLLATNRNRPARLGDLEAVSWTPPCESEHHRWTLDLWYLLAFDGRVGTGRSFLVDLEEASVVSARDFSVRTG